MQPSPATPRIVHFGVFEVDLAAPELRKRGRKVPLQDQPFKVLALLLRSPGEVVTREELQRALWPDDTFGDFDEGLNKAIQKLRQALDDSTDNPRFIETLPRKDRQNIRRPLTGNPEMIRSFSSAENRLPKRAQSVVRSLKGPFRKGHPRLSDLV